MSLTKQNKTTFFATPQDCTQRFVRIRYKEKEHTRFITGLRPEVPSSKNRMANTTPSLHRWKQYNQFEKELTPLPQHSVVQKTQFSPKIRQEAWCGSRQRYTREVANPVFVSIKEKTKGWKSFFMHDNGGRPFLVYIHPQQTFVCVYAVPDNVVVPDSEWSSTERQNQWAYTKLVYTSPPLASIFLGKSVKNPMTTYSGGYGRAFYANSILLHHRYHQYIFIGQDIFSFISHSPLVSYFSPVGNNDVPYAFAMDDIGRAYLMMEKVVLLAGTYDPNDPYTSYYNWTTQNKKTKAHPFRKVHIFVSRRL